MRISVNSMRGANEKSAFDSNAEVPNRRSAVQWKRGFGCDVTCDVVHRFRRVSKEQMATRRLSRWKFALIQDT